MRDKRNVITIILIVLVAAVGARIAQQKYALVDNDKTTDIARVEIPRTMEIPEGETCFIVMPKYIVNTSISDRPIEEFMEELEEANINDEYYENAVANPNRTVTIEVTGNQLEHLIETTETILNDYLEENKKYWEVDISSDFKRITFYVTAECNFDTWMWGVVPIQNQVAKAQLWIGTAYEDNSLTVEMISKETGEQVVSCYITDVDEERTYFEITEEEWDAKVKGQD